MNSAGYPETFYVKSVSDGKEADLCAVQEGRLQLGQRGNGMRRRQTYPRSYCDKSTCAACMLQSVIFKALRLPVNVQLTRSSTSVHLETYLCVQCLYVSISAEQF